MNSVKKESKDDELVFVPENENNLEKDKFKPWKILVVDDEESVHVVTKMVLGDFFFMGRPVKIYNAYSTKAAQKIISTEDDIAIILLDVILETPHAGLDFVKYVREKIKNDKVRVILRTGQPGEAPENEVILQYDINDYKYKTELTEPRLIAVIAASLRSYNAFCQLAQHKNDLEKQVKERTKQLEKAKDDALKANTAKTNFLAVMSHEIRTPMNSIIGLLELLSETMLKDDQKRTLDVIIDTSKSFLNLVNDILDFSKIESGHLHIEEHEFSPIEIIENVALAVKSQIVQKAIRLSTFIDPNIPEFVLGDAHRVRQIISNFANNSAKFTQVGEIDIRAELIKDSAKEIVVRFQVSDTGVGISEEGKKKIFSPFYQSEKKISRIYGGSGLGLSICKNLAIMMKGKIFFDSSANNGSCFAVEIPFKKNKDKVFEKQSYMKNSKIYALLFNNKSAKNICEYLQSWGADIKTTYNEDEFKENIFLGKVDADILFIDMPALSVEDVLKVAKKATIEKIKVIILPFCNNPPKEVKNVEILSPGITKRDNILSTFTSQISNKSNVAEKSKELIEANETNKILVVDDNPVNRLVIIRQMERLGALAEGASDGLEALSAITKKKYDLILTDCSMPNIDGFELTKKIRQKNKLTKEQLPIVAVTANAASEYKQKCVDCGMNDYLLKPFGIEDLKAMARKWLPNFHGIDNYTNEEKDKEYILQEISKKTKKPFFNTGSPIDMFRMLGVCKNDFSQLPEMLSLFLKSCSSSFDMILKSIEEKDYEEIGFYAHKLKSGALVGGASRLASVAYELEKSITNKNYTNIEFLKKFLQCAFWEISYFIQEYIKRN